MTYPTEPTHTPIGARLRERTQPLAPNDATYGYAHAYLTEAIGRLSQQAQEVADPEGDAPPLSTLLNPDTCPDWALPWLAQFVGIKLPAGLAPADARAIIHDVAGFSRGTPAALRAAAQLYLTGNKEVFFRERDGDPYVLEVVTQWSEVPPSDRGEPTNLVTNPSAELTASFGANSTVGATPVNLLTNPSGELGTPTIVAFSASSAGTGTTSSVVDTTAWARAGTHASRYNVLRTDTNPIVARCAPTGTGGIPVDPTHWYAFRLTSHLASLTGGQSAIASVQAALYWYTSTGSAGSPSFSIGPIGPSIAIGEASDAYVILQPPAGAAFASPTAYIRMIDNAAIVQNMTLDFDAFMLVDLGTATPPSSGSTTDPIDLPAYFDGDSTGYKWVGAAHASTSKPDIVRVRTQDWAKAGTWSTRLSCARDDAASITLRTDSGTNQGSSGRFQVTPNHFYAVRLRTRLRSGPIDYAQLQLVFYKPDNAFLSATSTFTGPRVTTLFANTEADLVAIVKCPTDAGYIAIRPLYKCSPGWVVLDLDADAIALYDLGTEFTGPIGTATDPADVPAYIDGDMPGAVWNGAPHASTSHPPITTLVRDALIAAKPGGLILNYRTVIGWDYQEMTTKGGTYAAQTLAYPTYKRLKEGP